MSGRIVIDSVEWEPVIGLEVHVQLLTESKMYCGCSARYAEAPPNTLVCPVCLGLPGALPVINRSAVEYTVLTGLALNCRIADLTKFDRKNYHYPDLMKGYQISQYDLPLCKEGWLEIAVDDLSKRVGITRVHLEEDTAKLLHREGPDGDYSLVDVNRSGVPLIEIVGEPDLRSAEEARQYLMRLREILRWLGVSTGNMEEGSFRCDANISMRPRGQVAFNPKVEIKNMNSFRAVYEALRYEAERQAWAHSRGEAVPQETRGWDDERGVTVGQRSKEYAHDYRYFPEPDLPPLRLTPAWVEGIRRKLPELPEARRRRYGEEFGLSPYDAELLTSNRAIGDFFEAVVGQGFAPKEVANWITTEIFRLSKEAGELTVGRITPETLGELLKLLEGGAINRNAAKTILETMYRAGGRPEAIAAAQGLAQISGESELEAIVERVIGENARIVADYRAGKTAALNALKGKVMGATKGRANPALVDALLGRKLQ